MGKKSLQQCKNHREFSKYAKRNGAFIEHGRRHDLAKTSKGHCALPRHNGDYGKGLRSAIIKTMIAIGLGLFVFAYFAHLLPL